MTNTDLQRILDPIPGDAPAGVSLEYEGAFDRIRDARREDDQTLPQGIWETDRKRADWGSVRRLCIEALAERSKDLQVAVWLLEASMNLDGFAGVRGGVEMIAELCERFWDELYPLPEGGDMEFRIAPLLWMNEKLSIRLRLLPVTRPATGDGKSYSIADLETARRIENLATKNPRAAQEEGEDSVTMAAFNASAMLTPDEFYRAIDRDISASLLLVDRLSAFLDEKCGAEGPSLQRFRRALEEVRGLAASILRDRMSERDSSEEEIMVESPAAYDGNGHETGEAPMPRAGIAIRSRDEAYALLSSVADYLMRVEPHSPAPYLVKRAVVWGSMPLSSLLQELVGENRDLIEIYKLLGMRER